MQDTSIVSWMDRNKQNKNLFIYFPQNITIITFDLYQYTAVLMMPCSSFAQSVHKLPVACSSKHEYLVSHKTFWKL